MRGVYTAKVDISSVSAAKTLLLGTNASTTVIEILRASVTNADQETLEQMRISLTRVNVLGSPVGATTPVINKTEAGSAATGLTWYGNLSTEPTSYVTDDLDSEGVANLGGYYFDPTPEERPYIAPSGSFGLRLLDAPTNATRLIAKITYREIG